MDDAHSDLGKIFDMHAPRIFRYIYHRIGDQSAAEDLTGEVFVRFLRARVAPDNIVAFLYRIAHNLVVDYFRRKHPIQIADLDAMGQSDPAHLAEIEIERATVRRHIARLTPDQQQVIVLKFLEGFSNEEIARVIGKPVGAVKALQHRALVALRELLRVEVRDGK